MFEDVRLEDDLTWHRSITTCAHCLHHQDYWWWSKYVEEVVQIWTRAVSALYCAASLWEKCEVKVYSRRPLQWRDRPVGVTEWMCSDVFNFRQFQSFYGYVVFLLLKRICFAFRDYIYIVVLFKNKSPKQYNKWLLLCYQRSYTCWQTSMWWCG
jgi:hypothetical protein